MNVRLFVPIILFNNIIVNNNNGYLLANSSLQNNLTLYLTNKVAAMKLVYMLLIKPVSYAMFFFLLKG